MPCVRLPRKSLEARRLGADTHGRNMNSWRSFDLPFLIRQALLLAGLCVGPVLVYAALSAKRRVLAASVGGLFILGWLFLVLSFLQTNLRIWSDSPVPYTPFRAGPSTYSLLHLAPTLGLFVWLPSLLALTIAHVAVRRRVGKTLQTRTAMGITSFFALAGLLWGWFCVTGSEFNHEDTVWSDGFSFASWAQVEPGMTREQVEHLLGKPFPEPIMWGQMEGEERWERAWWVRNWSAGYFAVVWFDKDRVQRKQFWYSD